MAPQPRPLATAVLRKDVAIPVGRALLPGSLAVPSEADGIVLFAHGSGSGRFSPRNVQVAETLNDAGLATLLFDLLTEEESADRANVFDVPLLAHRLLAAKAWVEGRPDLCDLPVGYFGASTGAAAALSAAAVDGVAAVVSRGGRPDLAQPRLADVRAPTLLIVGGNDKVVLELNRDSLAQLTCEAELHVVEGATHLFEEQGALEEVARLAGDWFVQHLGH